MNKWEERLCDKNDNRELLIESSEFTSRIKLNKSLKESLVMQSGKNGTLIVKNIPVTILDRENLNGRIYSTETMRQAIEEAKEAMLEKQTLGQANEHPESSFVAPTDASHVIINAYIKENINIVVDGKRERHNVLFTDWEVLNTTHGKDLRALFEAECSFGTSIRGVGELSGKMVQNYSFISVDGVGNPSSSTYTRMPVSESVKVEFRDANELKENYTVMSSSTNVVRDLSQAGVLQQQLNANPYGTITKTSTKVDQETDPKTGAQTSITTVEADTEDEVTDLNQAFQMAHKAMTNGISKVSSVTIEANEDEDEQGNKTESVDMSDNGLEAYVPESAPMEEGQVVAQGHPEGIEFLKTLDEKGRYMFLSRMQTDCKYFLDGHEYNKFLWAENPEKQIEYMKWLYNSFPDDKKPQWISMEEIEDYERQMVGKGKEDHSRDDIYTTESTEITEDSNLGLKQIVDLSGVKVMSPDEKELWRISDELRKAEDKNVMEWQRSYKSLVDAGVDQIYLDYANGKDMGEGYAAESTMTESKKEEEPKDPNDGRQYVLKIKNNDPDMKEDSDNAPEFVAMRGNAIRFTKDPKKALHFTQGMEESGIVHCSNIKKLLADMGYGEQNLEKWYKRDNGEVAPKKEGIIGGVIGGVAGAAVGHPSIGGAAGSLAQDALSDDSKEESAKLTEAGNTKYSATMELINGAGLPDMKSVDISSVDLDGAKEELGNHCNQQDSSSDGRKVTKAILIDNQSGEKYEYKKDTKELVPENSIKAQQPVQQKIIEEPIDNDIKIMNPEDVKLGTKEESVDGEIEQSGNTLSMDIDNNTNVKKEFDTQAQASVAKAGIESGKLSGDVLLSDAVKPGWYVAHDKIGVSGPYETREACMEGLDGYEDQVSVYEVTENDLNEVLFNKPSEPSDNYVEKPLEEDYFSYDEITPRDGDKGGYSFNGKNYNISAYRLDDDSSWEMRVSNKNGNPVTQWHKVECRNDEELFDTVLKAFDILDNNVFNGYAAESAMESSLVPVRFSNIKWDEKDAAYRMFEDIEKDMQISHIEPDVNNANILVEYFENYMNDLNNASVSYNVNPSEVKESANYQEEIIRLYNEDSDRQYPKIESADISLK